MTSVIIINIFIILIVLVLLFDPPLGCVGVTSAGAICWFLVVVLFLGRGVLAALGDWFVSDAAPLLLGVAALPLVAPSCVTPLSFLLTAKVPSPPLLERCCPVDSLPCLFDGELAVAAPWFGPFDGVPYPNWLLPFLLTGVNTSESLLLMLPLRRTAAPTAEVEPSELDELPLTGVPRDALLWGLALGRAFTGGGFPLVFDLSLGRANLGFSLPSDLRVDLDFTAFLARAVVDEDEELGR